MAVIKEYSNPSFARWPIQNSRTGLQPVNIPLLLVVPFARDPVTNAAVVDSGVEDLKFFIEEAPGLVPVAGFEHAGIFVPDFQRFIREVSSQELMTVKIDLSGLPFFDKDSGAPKEFSEAKSGDKFEYTLIRGITEHTGPRDRIEFIKGADYYDLSPFLIATAELKPFGKYRFSWQCNYFNRVLTPNGELFCIDTNDRRLARFSLIMAHPGEIHQMMMEQTPTVYFEGKPLEQDNLVKFYRPFADALNDIFDEQELLVGVNFLEKIPAQFIPYLAYLLGWDLPFFPGATDRIRRAVLRNARRLQQLKGSKRVIRELFELFGFTIDIINLWYRRDGNKFVGPGEKQPGFSDEEIEIQSICQTEVLMADYSTDGFGGFDIPLLFRPDGDITVDAWLVDVGSTAETQLKELLSAINLDPESLMAPICPTTDTGLIISKPLNDKITGAVLGHSAVSITQRLGAKDEVRTKEAPLSINGVKYDFDHNVINLTFDHHLKFNGKRKLYAFATYRRQKLVVPQKLTDLRSNRFDVEILLNRTGEAPSSQLLDFLLDFIFKLKAFHSILRKIVFTVPVTDVYNVIDFCIGGRVSQAPGTDLGELQTLPAIIPTEPGACSADAFRRGFKDTDFELRDEILKGLKAEHAAWKALDGTRDEVIDPLLESLSRVQKNTSSEAVYGATGIHYGSSTFGPDQDCEFTQHGQDRVLADQESTSGIVRKDFDHVTDDRPKLCDDTDNVIDNCYKGRVKQDAEITRRLLLREVVRCNPCSLMMGEGFYYRLPIKPDPITTTNYNKVIYGRAEYGAQEIDVRNAHNIGRSRLTDLMIRAAHDPVHYTNTLGLTDNDLTNDRIAIRRPSLDIDKDNMFFPGHRFVEMNRLESDFVHTEYYFRPWDDLFDQNRCPENIPVDNIIYGPNSYGIFQYNDDKISIDDLNPQLATDSEGDEILVFNQIPYKIYANGLVPDISSMGNHDERALFVTHSIYSNAGVSAAIDHSDGMITPASSDAVCFSDGYDPIFLSANRQCVCEPTATGTNPTGSDFIDGYPSVHGRFDFDIESFDYQRGESSDVDMELAAGLPSSGSSTPTDLLFKCGSGIKVGNTSHLARFVRPFRLDCGCLLFDCDETGLSTGSAATATATNPSEVPHVVRCNIGLFRDNDGIFDLNCDKIETFRSLIFVEEVGTCSTRLGRYPQTAADGALPIPNMLSFDPTKLRLVVDQNFPPTGEFFFIDPAGIIHEGSFEFDGIRMDITVTTKDPRVWGEPAQGFVKNNKVYRRGVVTTCRQVLELVDDQAIVLASGCTQKIDIFQTTFGCGDKLPVDPFAFHMNCGILDDIEFEIACGPGWTADDGTAWGALAVDSSGNVVIVGTGQQLYWIDAWSNSETIITVCPNGTESSAG